jgi:hypothetical protein
VRYVEELEDDAHVLVPRQRKRNQIFDQLRLPNQARPYDSVQILLTRLERLISRCVSVEATHLPVLADFALSTWLVDRLSIAPYLSVVGLPQSGKTTLLKILSLVCRRALLVSDITSASFYRACAQFTPTMLIDEAGSARDNRTLRHMLRAGTMRDVISVQANRSFHAYGAKAISWLEPPDDTALNSRCAFISMFEPLELICFGPTMSKSCAKRPHFKRSCCNFGSRTITGSSLVRSLAMKSYDRVLEIFCGHSQRHILKISTDPNNSSNSLIQARRYQRSH